MRTRQTNKTILDCIFEHYEQTYGITREAVTGKARSYQITMVRAILIVILKEELKLTGVEIGDIIGINHTNVVYHCKNHSGRKATERLYKERYNETLGIAKKFTHPNITQCDLHIARLEQEKDNISEEIRILKKRKKDLLKVANIILLLFLFAGCITKDESIQNDINEHRVVEIDGCEYIVMNNYPNTSDIAIAHKGNCRNHRN
jgi:hypothetical protein